MSRHDANVTNRDVIPVVASRLFETSPDSRFASGLIGRDGSPLPGLDNEFAGHFQLRRRVYVEQTGQLDPHDLHPDGTDRDEDDDRSVTFGVVENHDTGVRVVGVARLIIRGDEAEGAGLPLPVELAFPEIFSAGQLDARSCEISRLIARHEKAIIQDMVQWHLFAMILGYIQANRLGKTLAIIEPWLERHLNGIMSIQRLAEPRFVEHYLDYNVPIEVDTEGSAARVYARDADLIPQFQRSSFAMQYFGRASRSVRERPGLS